MNFFFFLDYQWLELSQLIPSSLLVFVRAPCSPLLFCPPRFGCFFLPITECYTVPGAPPRNVTGRAISTTAIEVSWEPPPNESTNGKIIYYKLHVVETGRSDSEALLVRLSNTTFTLDELRKWTTYRIWVAAGTSVGDGPPSYPITVRTYEDGMYPLTVSTEYLLFFYWFGVGHRLYRWDAPSRVRLLYSLTIPKGYVLVT